ncbi:MAG: hypothetical protein K2X81_25905 [Candidatus Obscuribacterales bacterium]|nr:hypothetical protein [Candidatus Obscuribacterales bacterium]
MVQIIHEGYGNEIFRCLANRKTNSSYVRNRDGRNFNLNVSTELVFANSSHMSQDFIARRYQQITVQGHMLLAASEVSLASVLAQDPFVRSVCQQPEEKPIFNSILRLAACLYLVTQNHGAYRRN